MTIAELRQAEIGELDAAVPRQQHVGRLDVPMDDPVRVSGGERLRNRQGKLTKLMKRKRAPPGLVAQRAAVDPFEDEKRPSVGLADIVDRQNIGVVQRGQRSRLTTQPIAVFGAEARGVRHELQGDIAAETVVMRPVHHAHAALADSIDHAVVLKAVAGADMHGQTARRVSSLAARPNGNRRGPGRRGGKGLCFFFARRPGRLMWFCSGFWVGGALGGGGL